MKKVRFQKRLLLGVFALLSALILLGGSFFCWFAMRNAQATELATMEQITERVSLQVDGIYRQMGIAATATVTNPQLQNIVFELNTKSDLSPYQQLQYNTTITSNMTANLFYLSDAQNAFLYNANRGYCYYTGLYLWDEEAVRRHANDTAHYAALVAACPDTYILMPPHANPWKPDGKPVISVVKRFFDNERVENALFEVQLPYTALEDVCRQDSFSDTRQILIFDDMGRQVFPFAADTYVLDEGSLSAVRDALGHEADSGVTAQYLFAANRSNYTGWRTVLTGDPAPLHRQFSQYFTVTILFLLLVAGGTLAVLVFLTGRLTRPLNKLVDEVRSVSLDKLIVDFGSDTPDELTALDESFHAMFQKLHDSVQEIYEMRIRETNAHLQALQSQINPHFLYNTLNAIGAAARVYGGDTATEMCQSLANMMRYITSRKEENLLVDEMTHTRNYLSLCQIPYGEEFSYSINVPAEMYNILIPKLTIQPIVENAVSHGFEVSTPPYVISINGSICGDGRWCLIVTDNGQGFSEEKISELDTFVAEYRRRERNALDTASLDIGGLGLKNIFTRLLIVFDGDVEFSIVNHEVGCSVSIVGPHSKEAPHGQNLCS